MKKITLIAMLFAMAFVAHAQTLTITAVTSKTPAEFMKSSSRLLAVLNGETRADSTQKQDSTLSIIVFAKGVKAEVSKEEYNRILDLYASKHGPMCTSCTSVSTVQFLEANAELQRKRRSCETVRALIGGPSCDCLK